MWPLPASCAGLIAAVMALGWLQAPAALSVPTFSDITAKAGIHFRHNNGAFGKK